MAGCGAPKTARVSMPPLPSVPAASVADMASRSAGWLMSRYGFSVASRSTWHTRLPPLSHRCLVGRRLYHTGLRDSRYG